MFRLDKARLGGGSEIVDRVNRGKFAPRVTRTRVVADLLLCGLNGLNNQGINCGQIDFGQLWPGIESREGDDDEHEQNSHGCAKDQPGDGPRRAALVDAAATGHRSRSGARSAFASREAHFLAPSPRRSTINLSAGLDPNSSVTPSGQRTRIASTVAASPRPKCARGS